MENTWTEKNPVERTTAKRSEVSGQIYDYIYVFE